MRVKKILVNLAEWISGNWLFNFSIHTLLLTSNAKVMKTRCLFIAISMIAGCIPSAAFRIVTGYTGDIAPEMTIDRQEGCVTVSYDFVGAVSVVDELYPGCVRLDIPGFGHKY